MSPFIFYWNLLLFPFFFNFSTTDQNLNYTYIFVWVCILLLVNDNWTDSVYSWSFFYSLWLKFQCQTHILVFLCYILEIEDNYMATLKVAAKKTIPEMELFSRYWWKERLDFLIRFAKFLQLQGATPPGPQQGLHPCTLGIFSFFTISHAWIWYNKKKCWFVQERPL